MRMIRFKHSFAFKFILYILTCIAVIFLLLLIYNYRAGEKAIKNNLRNNSRNLVTDVIGKISTFLGTVPEITQDISEELESYDITQEKIMELLKTKIKNCENISGSTIAFEPYAFEKNKFFLGRYFYRAGNDIKYVDLGAENNCFKSDLYTIPKKLNKGVWSEPHFNRWGRDTLMVTYSQPLYKTVKGEQKFCGVVTGDIDLCHLKRFVSDIKIFETGYIFILSSKGVYIEHKDKEHTDLRKSIFFLAESRGDIKLKELGEKMTSNQFGFEDYYSYTLGKKCFISYGPLLETGWSVGVVIPKDEIFSDLHAAIRNLFTLGVAGYILIIVLVVISFLN